MLHFQLRNGKFMFELLKIYIWSIYPPIKMSWETESATSGAWPGGPPPMAVHHPDFGFVFAGRSSDPRLGVGESAVLATNDLGANFRYLASMPEAVYDVRI